MTVSIIGCGNMGSSIASALKKSGKYDLVCHDVDPHRVEALGLECAPSLEDALSKGDIIILAVKPQVVGDLYDILTEYNDKSYISILAGVPLEVLEYKLDADNIARFMPNIAARSSASVTAIAISSACDDGFVKNAFDIASTFGSAFLLDEKLFPAFIGLSGSGIAYVFQFIHSMAMGAVEEGIPYPRAVEIASDTLLSALTLVRDTKKNPIELMSMVCSAGGTTVSGMNTLSENGFDNAVIRAVRAASQKSMKLEKEALEKKDND